MKLRFFLPLLLIAAVVLWIVFSPSGSSEEEVLRERGLQIREIDDPEGPVTQTVVVAPEEIPQNMPDRETAPAFALLPNRAGYPEMRGESKMPPGEKAKVKKAAEEFLTAWETYDPGGRGYADKLSSFVSEDFLSAVAAREDAVDAPGICPDPGCKRGSRWYRSPSFSSSAFVIDWKEPQVYLVAYGAVLYDEAGQEAGSSERSYGILMRKIDGVWKIERVAAESLR